MSLGSVQFLFSENINVYFQGFGSPFLDILVIAVTNTCSEQALILFASIIFWCFSKKTGIRVIYVILFSAFTALFAKNFFSMSRPPEYLHKIQEDGFGFPSGHALVTSGFWGYLGSKIRNPWVIFTGAVLITSVSISRIYLGVHYVGDVMGGIAFGLSLAVIFFKTEASVIIYLQNMDRKLKYFVAVIIPMILVLASMTQRNLLKEQIEIGIIMASVGTGYLLEEEFVRFGDVKNNAQRIKRGFTGVLLLAFIYLISGLLFYDVISLKYTILGFSSTFIVPWVFTRMEKR